MTDQYPEARASARRFHEGFARFRPTLTKLAGLIWPAHCLLCERQLAAQAGLCTGCWHGVGWCFGASCYCCGAPVAPGPSGERAEERWCSTCAENPPLWRHARAVLRYDGPAKKLIYKIKKSPRAEIFNAAGQWMAEAARAVLAPERLVIPVPLHSSRLRSRGFNQSVLLARAMLRHAPGEISADVLHRIRAVPKLAHIPRANDRAHAIEGSIACLPHAARKLSGRDVLLVDDVLTSGATLNLCAQVLRQHGARHIDVVVLARNCRSLERREFFQIAPG